ncbi:MAG: ParB/RepB/Spo0J family partition protein [Ruminococcaceae bacterium]|nr:ParB/RepB/Spo0J family partition protein [Oscillospiraceae bacterium]
MSRPTGLGKGLNALFAENEITTQNPNEITTLRISCIEPDKDQHRKSFDAALLDELAQSIALHGVIQPIVVRPLANGNYKIIAGERRWRASKLAGLDEVPVIIRDIEDMEAAEIALIENLQREDLNPVDEANGYHRLITDFNITQEEAAKKVGKSRTVITNALRLLNLPAEALTLLKEKRISAGHARALLGLKDAERIPDICKMITEKAMSVRSVESLVKQINSPKAQKSQQELSKDAYMKETERKLSSELGRRVNIKYNSGKESGSLVLEYFDNDDLEEILSLLCRNDIKTVLNEN